MLLGLGLQIFFLSWVLKKIHYYPSVLTNSYTVLLIVYIAYLFKIYKKKEKKVKAALLKDGRNCQ